MKKIITQDTMCTSVTHFTLTFTFTVKEKFNQFTMDHKFLCILSLKKEEKRKIRKSKIAK